MTFELTVALGNEEYREFVQLQMKQRRFRCLLPVLTCVALTIALTGFLSAGYNLLLVALSLFALVWYLVFPMAVAARHARQNSEVDMMAPVQRRFTEEKMTFSHPLIAGEIDYAAITRLFETESQLVLWIGRSQAVLLPKIAFTVGTSEDFKTFLSGKTGLPWKTVNTKKVTHRRYLAAALSLLIALSLVTAAKGVTYIRGDVRLSRGEETCTLSLPYFLKQDGNRLSGNGLTVTAAYYTHAELQQRMIAAGNTTAPSIASYSTFEKQQGLVLPQGNWVYDGRDEVYMQYARGAEYVCTVLHWTDSGCWRLEFICPGERQDTYYNRFDTWRSSATYSE